MKRVLSATGCIVALTVAAPGWASSTFHPLGGPYYPESAPSPPAFERAPSYYPLATMYPYGYGYRYYYRPYARGY